MASRTDSRTKIEDAKQKLLQLIDVRQEYEKLQLRFAPGATVRESGWISCFALDRKDDKPSAAINVDSGCYKDSGGAGWTLSFWDAQVKFGPFTDWYEALQHFADAHNIKLASKPDETSKDQVELAGLLNPLNTRGFRAKYPGVRIEDLQACGARLVRYPKKSPEPFYCIAWPFYGPGLVDSPNRGWVVQATDGRELEDARGQRQKRLSIGQHSGLANWTDLNNLALKKAKIVIKVEGFSDMMALLAIRPEAKRTSVAITTNACGAHETSLPAEIGKVFAGVNLVVIHDADEPGQVGAKKWVAGAQDHAKSVRNVQLYKEIAPKHGKDMRDWIADGHGWDDLEKLIEATLPDFTTEKPPSASEEMLQKLNLTVYGMTDAAKRSVLIFDSKGRRRVIDPAFMHEADVRQLAGPELCKKYINLSDDEPDPLRFSVKNVAMAIADVSSNRMIRDEAFHGDGIWKTGDDCLTLVQAGGVMNWNGTKKLEPTTPFAGDTVFDQSGNRWFEPDEISALVERQKTHCDQSIETLDEAIEIFRRWDNFKYPDSAELISALIPATFLQGVWDARPLVAITGRTNTGKTYLRDAVKATFGKLLDTVSKSTEAGVRSLIGNKSIVVWMDEFEDSKHRKAMLDLLRTSLRGDTIVRSSSDQKLMRFGLKHIVWTSAQELGLTEAADINRYITFELKPVPIGKGSTLVVPLNEELHNLGQRLMVAGLLHWKTALAMTKEIRKLSFDSLDRRLVEIYSVPICMTAAIRGESLEQAAKRMRESLGQRENDIFIEHDESALLHEILTADVKTENGKTSSVGQMLVHLSEKSGGYDSTPVDEALERVGIALKGGPLRSDMRVFIHPKTIMQKLLSKTSANKDVRLILRRLADSKTDDRHRMNGKQLAGISIPLKAVLTRDEESENVFAE